MKRQLLSLITLLLLSSCREVKPEPNYYRVTWLNEDGNILEVDERVLEGEMPEYNSDFPTKESDSVYDYSFNGWDKQLSPVIEDVSYTATFDSLKRVGFIESSHPSGFYNEDFLLTLTTARGFDIYYTLDNTDPDESSTLYEGPIQVNDVSSHANYYCLKEGISSLDVYYPTELVDKCLLIKAIAINRVSKETSPLYYFNYFVNYQNKSGYDNLPVITLNINEDDLYDYEKGIYVTGKIYDEAEHTGYPEAIDANYHQKGKEWERKANFKYFDESKKLTLEQNIGVRIHGGWSRAFNQKSFNLYARKEYSDSSTFGIKFFSDINAHSLMLRSGGYRDTTLTKLRDSLNQDLSKDEPFDTQRSKPAIVFLNGEYWGIYNLQERFSDNYVKEHHEVKKDNVLIIKNDAIDEGKESDYHFYEELKSFFSENTFANHEKYEEAKSYIDMEEFASYMATQLYVGNIDWPGNNVRVYKDVVTPDSKWHFMMYDSDDSSNILSHMCNANIDPFLKKSHWKSGPLESDCLLGLMLSKLIENSEFKALFRNTFTRIGSVNFSSERVATYLSSKKALLTTPMVKNYKRFVNNNFDESYFLEKVDIIQTFFDNRYEYAIDFLNLHIPE